MDDGRRTIDSGTMTPLDADVLQKLPLRRLLAYMLREVELPCKYKYRCVYAAASVTTVVGWRSGESKR